MVKRVRVKGHLRDIKGRKADVRVRPHLRKVSRMRRRR